MPAVRKMLGSATSPYIVSLMRAIETQSVHTIASWATAYACEQLLPIFEAAFAQDARPRQALDAAQAYLRGECKLADAKKSIRTAQTAAQEAAAIPAAQAAARGVRRRQRHPYAHVRSISGLLRHGGARVCARGTA